MSVRFQFRNGGSNSNQHLRFRVGVPKTGDISLSFGGSGSGSTVDFMVPDSPPFSNATQEFFLPKYLANRGTRKFYIGQIYYPIATNVLGGGYLKQEDTGIWTIIPSNVQPSTDDLAKLFKFVFYDPDLTWNTAATGSNTHKFFNQPTNMPNSGDYSIFNNSMNNSDGLFHSVSTCNIDNRCNDCGDLSCVPGTVCSGNSCRIVNRGMTQIGFGLRQEETHNHVLTYSPPSGGMVQTQITRVEKVPQDDFDTTYRERWFFADLLPNQGQFQVGLRYPLYVVVNGQKMYFNQTSATLTPSYDLVSSPTTMSFAFVPQSSGRWNRHDFDVADFDNFAFLDSNMKLLSGKIELKQNPNLTGDLAVNDNPNIFQITTAPDLPNATVGQVYSKFLTTTGGTPPISFEVTANGAALVASGLGLIPTTGRIFGTPTMAVNNLGFDITAFDSNGNQNNTRFFINIVAPSPPQITTTSLVTGFVGMTYVQPIMVMGGSGGNVFSATGLPSSLSISGSSGIISSDDEPLPSSSVGTHQVEVKVEDSLDQMDSQKYTLTIIQPGSTSLMISPTTLPNGQVGEEYGPVQFMSSNATGTVTWQVKEGLSSFNTAGLTLSSEGVLSGTPTSATQSTPLQFTIQAIDSDNNIGTQSLSLTIEAIPPLMITTTSLPKGQMGQAYPMNTIMATGGVPPYSWSQVGTAVPGLTLNSTSTTASFSGTPTQTGTFMPVVQVTDSSSPPMMSQQNFTIAIEGESPPGPTPPSPSTPFYREWWFWVIVGVIVLIFIAIIGYATVGRRSNP